MNYLFKFIFIVNSLALVVSVPYLFLAGESALWNVYGLLLIVAFTGNSVASMIGSRYKKLDSLYLLFSSIGLLTVMLLNTVASINVTNESSISLVSTMILLLLLIMGTIITSQPMQHYNSRSSRKTYSAYGKETNAVKVFRLIVLVFSSLALLAGGLMGYVLVTSSSSGLMEVFVSQYSLFYSFIFLSTAGLFIKFSRFVRFPFVNYIVIAFGGVLFIVFALPFLAIPNMLKEAEENYTEAFGQEGLRIGQTVADFKNVPLSIPAYFFGIPSDSYTLTEDVVYYEGTEGVDEGLELRFDVYTPPSNVADLPGERSILIRIHGGGWDTGGKGAENFAQVNKYFANQGYVVFDVQYGLNDQDQFVDFATVSEEVSGNFSIDDMVRHLGLFTTYLADRHEDYDANINSVFISGGSAGGHLANAIALGSSSGEYSEIVDSRLSINGIIPFYPANGLAGYRELGGEEELVDPALLVDENSPPALVYQGDKDGIVDPQVAVNFREAYLENGNTQNAIINMPYGAHGSDLYFPGIYSQTFTYYMERFMYQYK